MNIYVVIHNTGDCRSSFDDIEQITYDQKLIKQSSFARFKITHLQLPRGLENDEIFYILLSNQGFEYGNEITVHDAFIDIESAQAEMRDNLKPHVTSQILECKFGPEITYKDLYYADCEVYDDKRFCLLYQEYKFTLDGIEYNYIPWFDQTKENYTATILERNKCHNAYKQKKYEFTQMQIEWQKQWERQNMEQHIRNLYPTQSQKILDFIDTIKEP